jgi:hypothetical protein
MNVRRKKRKDDERRTNEQAMRSSVCTHICCSCRFTLTTHTLLYNYDPPAASEAEGLKSHPQGRKEGAGGAGCFRTPERKKDRRSGQREGEGEGEREGRWRSGVEHTTDLWNVPESMRETSTWREGGREGGREGALQAASLQTLPWHTHTNHSHAVGRVSKYPVVCLDLISRQPSRTGGRARKLFQGFCGLMITALPPFLAYPHTIQTTSTQ